MDKPASDKFKTLAEIKGILSLLGSVLIAITAWLFILAALTAFLFNSRTVAVAIAGAAGVLFFVRWINRRDDPRHAIRPPDPP